MKSGGISLQQVQTETWSWSENALGLFKALLTPIPDSHDMVSASRCVRSSSGHKQWKEWKYFDWLDFFSTYTKIEFWLSAGLQKVWKDVKITFFLLFHHLLLFGLELALSHYLSSSIRVFLWTMWCNIISYFIRLIFSVISPASLLDSFIF